MVGRKIVGRRRRRRGRGRIKRAVIPEFIVSPAKFKIDRTEILFFLYPVVSFIFVQLVTGVVGISGCSSPRSSSQKFWNEAVNLPNFFLHSLMLKNSFPPEFRLKVLNYV